MLQLYYGNLDIASKILKKTKETFPHIPVELNFETPNYKVQAGYFKDKLIGNYDLQAYENIKKQNIISRLMSSINFLIWGDV